MSLITQDFYARDTDTKGGHLKITYSLMALPSQGLTLLLFGKASRIRGVSTLRHKNLGVMWPPLKGVSILPVQDQKLKIAERTILPSKSLHFTFLKTLQVIKLLQL